MLSPELTKHVQQLTQSNIPFVLATVVRAQSPTAARPGDKAVVTVQGDIYGWIGGGCAQPAVAKSARQVLATREPVLIRVEPGKQVQVEDGVVSFRSSCPSGGTLDIFIEPVYQRPLLWVFGSSPVAKKLAELAAVADYQVHVAAPMCEPEQFPLACHFQAELELAQEQTGKACYAVVATQGKRDIAALNAALTLNTRFLGFVASRKKADKYKQDLLAKGHAPSQIKRIVSPVGIDIVAKSPAEIALSILTQLTQTKNAAVEVAQTSCTEGASSPEPVTPDNTEKQNSGGCCGS